MKGFTITPERIPDMKEMELTGQSFRFDLEQLLANKVGLSSLNCGPQVVRNEKGWRDNELFIENSLVIHVARSFVGFGGIFFHKLKETTFRDQLNPEKSICGIFVQTAQQSHEVFFQDCNSEWTESITTIHKINLLEAGENITLDGTLYNIHVSSPNIDTKIVLNNPSGGKWTEWEKAVFHLGKSLAKESKMKEMQELFG